MSIKEKLQKIKLFLTESERREKTLIIGIIFLVGIASFGLGRLSAFDAQKEPVKIEMNGNLTPEVPQVKISGTEKKEAVLGAEIELKKGGFVVASKNGNKYHFPWCSGGKRILEENKIYFESTEEARAAGYEPAGNCKGLE